MLTASEASNADTAQVVALGMLCEAKRNGEIVIGIVAAIHSTGRLTLLVPDTVRRDNVDWHRIVVSPRQHFRMLSTDHVLFMRLPARIDDGQNPEHATG